VDYLEDLQGLARDPVFYYKFWHAYDLVATPQDLKDCLPPDQWARYEPKLERCRRIELIRPEIERRKVEIHLASWTDPGKERIRKLFPVTELPPEFQDFIDEKSKQDPLLAFALDAFRKFHRIDTTSPAS
jgi:hypothetical protein